MKRDIIDSLLAGGLLSFLPIWEVDTGERIALIFVLAVLVYIGILYAA